MKMSYFLGGVKLNRSGSAFGVTTPSCNRKSSSLPLSSVNRLGTNSTSDLVVKRDYICDR